MGELLVAEIDAKVGGIGIVPRDVDGAVVSSHYFLFQIDETKCIRAWLDWFIRSGGLEDQIKSRGSTNYAAIRPQHVLEFELPILSLDEQSRIVSRIEELAAKIEQVRALRDKSATQSNLLFEYESIQVLSGRKRFADFAAIALPPVGSKVRRGVLPPSEPNPVAATWMAPDGWLRLSIAELLMRGILLDVKDGNHGENHPKASEFTDRGMPFLMAKDLRNRMVDWGCASMLGEETVKRLKVGFAKTGDVLFTHKASIGRTAIADRNCILSPQVTYYRCNPQYINGGWLAYFLSSRLFLSQLEDIKGQTTRDFVSIGKQYGQFVLLPPLPEQRHIVAYLHDIQAKVDSLKKLQFETATELDALMPSILSKAFRGEL